MLLIYGTKTFSESTGQSLLDCPTCAKKTAHTLLECTRYFTLFFIRLVQLGAPVTIATCNLCGSRISSPTAARAPASRTSAAGAEMAPRQHRADGVTLRSKARRRTVLSTLLFVFSALFLLGFIASLTNPKTPRRQPAAVVVAFGLVVVLPAFLGWRCRKKAKAFKSEAETLTLKNRPR